MVGHGWVKEVPQVGVLSKSSRLDLDPAKKASYEVEAFPSGLSAIRTLEDIMDLLAVEGVSDGLVLDRCISTVARWSGSLSSVAREPGSSG